jgi:hypothetical protein
MSKSDILELSEMVSLTVEKLEEKFAEISLVIKNLDVKQKDDDEIEKHRDYILAAYTEPRRLLRKRASTVLQAIKLKRQGEAV